MLCFSTLNFTLINTSAEEKNVKIDSVVKVTPEVCSAGNHASNE